MVITTLTHCGDWSPVGQDAKLPTNKQTGSETHDVFKQVLTPTAEAALGENHLPEELVLPEGVNRHQVSPGGGRGGGGAQQTRSVCPAVSC